MSLLLRRFRNDRRFRTLWIPVGLIAITSILAGFLLSLTPRFQKDDGTLASRLQASGDFEAAEWLFWQRLQADPSDVSTLIELIDNRSRMIDVARFLSAIESSATVRPAVSDTEIITFLTRDDLEPTVATLGRFWFAVRLTPHRPDDSEIRSLADREPPERMANHLLARAAMLDEDLEEAALRFDREGTSFPLMAGEDLEYALALWMDLEAWNEVTARLTHPAYAPHIGPRIRRNLAVHEEDWISLAIWIWPASFEDVQVWPVILALLAAVLWFWIAARMGKISEGGRDRLVLFLTAFALGVISVYPTLVTIVLEEKYLRLTEVGEPIRDAIFFVFGVGLREELWKLLLFLPLLPVLRRRRSRVEALICGAMVGLGFAAEENIAYFSTMALPSAIERFLTANFLHMSLTALVAVSIFDGSKAREGSLDHFHTVFPLAVFLHGAYDFFLSSAQFSNYSLLAMALFVILAKRFLREVVHALSSDERERTLQLFTVSLVLLSGAAYVYASSQVDPIQAFVAVGSGFLGVIILVFMFVMELGET